MSPFDADTKLYKKTEKDEVQLHISYELYRISEIK